MTGDLGVIPRRARLRQPGVVVRFVLAPGDRPLVAPGESVVAGTPIAEHLRDPRLEEVAVAPTLDPRPGARAAGGELLFAWHDRWRLATGDVTEPIETPVSGIVREVRPGDAISILATGRALCGIVVLGGPTSGRLHIASASAADLRTSVLDVGLSGSILVVTSRIDAETLTRARAMGVRGVIVGGLASKERRDFLASEARQRAALHRLAPFAVLVLEGAVRRPLASPIMAVLRAIAGREVAIVPDPPALLFDAPDLSLPAPPDDQVRIRGGAFGGREGTVVELPGPRQFAGGIQLESAIVRLDDGALVAVAIGDLERFG
jgi:hypothetical protein